MLPWALWASLLGHADTAAHCALWAICPAAGLGQKPYCIHFQRGPAASSADGTDGSMCTLLTNSVHTCLPCSPRQAQGKCDLPSGPMDPLDPVPRAHDT